MTLFILICRTFLPAWRMAQHCRANVQDAIIVPRALRKLRAMKLIFSKPTEIRANFQVHAILKSYRVDKVRLKTGSFEKKLRPNTPLMTARSPHRRLWSVLNRVNLRAIALQSGTIIWRVQFTPSNVENRCRLQMQSSSYKLTSLYKGDRNRHVDTVIKSNNILQRNRNLIRKRNCIKFLLLFPFKRKTMTKIISHCGPRCSKFKWNSFILLRTFQH